MKKSDFLVKVTDVSGNKDYDGAKYDISFWIDDPSLNGTKINPDCPAGKRMYDDHMEDVFPNVWEKLDDMGDFDSLGEGFFCYYGNKSIDEIRKLFVSLGFTVEDAPTSRIKTVKELANEKIKTEDCVDAIVQFYAESGDPNLTDPKCWKRQSKKGSGTIYRVFKNTKTDKSVTVEATETEILKIYETDSAASSGIPRAS